MKKALILIVSLAALATLIWLVWFAPAAHEGEEAKPATEVTVQVGKITRATLRGYVTAYGTVEPEPSGERTAASARVAPSAPGVIAEVKCAEGQRVEKGTMMFQLDSRAADAAADKARQTVEFGERTLERQRKLMQVEGTSQKLLLEAEQALATARGELAAAQTQQALLRVQAPLSGTVVRLNVKPGEAVDLTTVLAEVIDLDRLVVSASVPSAELAALRTGQPVEVSTHGSPPLVKGLLNYVSPQVDARTGAAVVRAGLPANSGLRPGQFVTLRIVVEEHADRLAVPVQSVVNDAEGNPVVALVQGDKAVQKPVKTGLRDTGLVEIEAEGLQADMTVVTEGAYGLPKETKVRVAGP